MRLFLTTTAVALVTTGFAFAQGKAQPLDLFEASELMGMSLYAGDPEGTFDDWNDIGEINDLLVDVDGEMPAAIVGVGGFLGIGEKDVRLSLDRIRLVTGEDGERFFVIDATQQDLEQAEAYVPLNERDDPMQQAEAEVADETEEAVAALDATAEDVEAEAEETVAEAGATIDGAEAEAEEAMAETEAAVEGAEAELEQTTAEADAAIAEEAAETEAAMMARADIPTPDGYTTLQMDQLNTEDLTGARVYDANDRDIGEIGELLITDNGQIDKAIVDVGGFLGLGEKPVALGLDEINIVSDDVGGLRVYVGMTEDELEEMNRYEG